MFTEKMKILSIGNSFSTDSQKWLHEIAISAGKDLFCANLYIGGCSLESHYNNYIADRCDYDLEINGEFNRKISLKDALYLYRWDVVTFQQVSGLSGKIETVKPYLSYLNKEVKKIQPDAILYYHQTWAYDTGSNHPDFNIYGCDRERMKNAIHDTAFKVSEAYGLKLIKTGDFISVLRTLPCFNENEGGIVLTRDSFHLSYNYGRYAAGLVWFCTLTGISARYVDFIPFIDNFTTDPKIIAIIKNTYINFYEK